MGGGRWETGGWEHGLFSPPKPNFPTMPRHAFPTRHPSCVSARLSRFYPTSSLPSPPLTFFYYSLFPYSMVSAPCVALCQIYAMCPRLLFLVSITIAIFSFSMLTTATVHLPYTHHHTPSPLSHALHLPHTIHTHCLSLRKCTAHILSPTNYCMHTLPAISLL